MSESFELLKRRARVEKIPTGWKLTSVGSACAVCNEQRTPISSDDRAASQGKYAYYGPTGILDHISEFRYHGRFALIGEDGDHFIKHVEKAQTLLVDGMFSVNNHAHVVGSTADCSADWFAWYFRHRSLRDLLTRQGASRYKLTKEALQSLPILLPPPSEQAHITGVLHTWDVAIDKIEQLIVLKEKRALAASQFWYLGSMPEAKSEGTENWVSYLFGDIFEEALDKNPGLCASDVITVGKYAIRPQSEHFSRSVASKELSSYLLLRPGDFVYDPMSAYYGAIGRYTRASPGVVSPAYRVLHLRHGFDASYIDGLLKSHYVRFQLQTRSSQNNKEGKRRLLGREEFNAIRVRIPPVAAQSQIAAILRTFSSDLEVSRKTVAALQRQKRGLMQKLLTGEWRVPIRDSDVEAMADRVTEEAAQ